MLVGAAVLCWAIWRYRNDIIFNKTKYSPFIQAIFRGTYWLRLWVHLQHEDMTNVLFRMTSLALETVALEIANRGWKHNLRIGLDYFPFIFFSQFDHGLFCNNLLAIYTGLELVSIIKKNNSYTTIEQGCRLDEPSFVKQHHTFKWCTIIDWYVQATNLEYSTELRKEEKRVKNEVDSTSSMSATSKEWQLKIIMRIIV